MGSTGSGRFSDYSGTKNADNTGGASGEDRCRQAFSCALEEVALCDFYVTNSDVPTVGTQLTLIHAGRIFATTLSSVKVGALPTTFNYLASCMKDGNEYIGIVRDSGLKPLPYVIVDFTAK